MLMQDMSPKVAQVMTFCGMPLLGMPTVCEPGQASYPQFTRKARAAMPSESVGLRRGL